jgi:hypothetical protein
MRDNKDLLDFEIYTRLDTYQIRFVEGIKSKAGSKVALPFLFPKTTSS